MDELDQIFNAAHGLSSEGNVAAVATPSTELDLDAIFDSAHGVSPATQVPSEDGYLSRLVSTIFSPKNLASDAYDATIGSLASAGNAIRKANTEVLDPKSEAPEVLKNLAKVPLIGPLGAVPAEMVRNFYKDKTLTEGIYDTGKLASNVLPVVGPYAYDKINQAVSPDIIAPTTPEQDARALRQNAIGTVVLMGAPKVISKTTEKTTGGIANVLEDSAQATREGALGIQFGDRKGGLKNTPVFLDAEGNVVPRAGRTIQNPDGSITTSVPFDTATSLQQKIETLRKEGFFEKAPDSPTELLAYTEHINAKTQTKIGDLIKEADEAIGDKIFEPDWTNAEKYVASQRGSERRALMKELEDVKADYEAASGTGLQRVITLKNQLGTDAKFNANKAPKTAELLQQAYYDLQGLGEKIFDNALPSKKGEFAKNNEIAAAQHSLLETIPTAAARDNPGFWKRLFKPEGSSPALAAAAVGGYIAGPAGAALAAGAVRGIPAAKGAVKGAKPMTYANTMEALADRVMGVSEASGAVPTLPPWLASALTTGDDDSALTSQGLGTGAAQRSTRKAVDTSNQTAAPSDPLAQTSMNAAQALQSGLSVPGQKSGQAVVPSLPNTAATPTAKQVSNLTRLMNLIVPEAHAEDMDAPMQNIQEKEAFATKVSNIAQDLEADPEHLLAVMNFETGGELSSKTKNKAGSGAIGLIQFMPATAKALTGAETKAAAIKILEDMTPTEQLDYVKKYLAPFKGKLNSLEDVYMAVLYPKAVGKEADYALFREGTKAYWQNRGLDIDKDGIVTKSEAASKVRNYQV